eukprot:4011272-Prymnesium_polylepis.1
MRRAACALRSPGFISAAWAQELGQMKQRLLHYRLVSCYQSSTQKREYIAPQGDAHDLTDPER